MTQERVIRDSNSKAILSTDTQALNKYKMERNYYRKIDKLQSDVTEIQETLSYMCKRIAKLEKE